MFIEAISIRRSSPAVINIIAQGRDFFKGAQRTSAFLRRFSTFCRISPRRGTSPKQARRLWPLVTGRFTVTLWGPKEITLIPCGTDLRTVEDAGPYKTDSISLNNPKNTWASQPPCGTKKRPDAFGRLSQKVHRCLVGPEGNYPDPLWHTICWPL